MDYLSKFNDVFRELIADLVAVFPQDSELRLYKLGLEAFLFADKKLISTVFYDEVAKQYADKIKQQDESFFLDKDYNEYNNSCDNVSDIVNKLKSCWMELNTDNKEIIWKYFKVLVTLSEKLYKCQTI